MPPAVGFCLRTKQSRCRAAEPSPPSLGNQRGGTKSQMGSAQSTQGTRGRGNECMDGGRPYPGEPRGRRTDTRRRLMNKIVHNLLLVAKGMSRLCRATLGLVAMAICFVQGAAAAQSKELAARPGDRASKAAGPELTKQPTLYVVGYAHLDTQWRWEYP